MRFILFLAGLACALGVHAQDRIYRCGNEYTNTVTDDQAKACKLVSGSNVTVIQGSKVAAKAVSGAASQQHVDSGAQRAKDADARQILEAELKKAQARQDALLKEYNGGQPDKLGPETHNNQKYLDRIADLKAQIDRNASDIDGITRELAARSP